MNLKILNRKFSSKHFVNVVLLTYLGLRTEIFIASRQKSLLCLPLILSKERSRTRASEILLKENQRKIVKYPKSFQFIDISNLRKQYRASRLSTAFGLIELLRFQYNHVIGQ